MMSLGFCGQCRTCLGGTGTQGLIIGPLSWSPDGKWLVYSGRAGTCLIKANPSGTDTTVMKEEKNGGLLLLPVWCLEKDAIVYEWVDEENCEIRRLCLSSGTEACIFKSQGEIRELRLSPDGRWVSFVLRENDESNLYMLSVDGGTKPILLANDVSGREYSHSWGPSGKVVAAIRHETNGAAHGDYLALIAIPDKKTTRLEGCGPRILAVEWSPNSDLIAYCARSEAGIDRIWFVHSDGSLPRACSSGSIDLHPDWSPDGRLLAYVKTRRVDGGKPENRVFVMTRTGKEETELHEVGPASASFPKWSPDGHRIACIVTTPSGDGKFAMKVVVVQYASEAVGETVGDFTEKEEASKKR